MNLTFKSFLLVLLGAGVGAGIGYAVSLVLQYTHLSSTEDPATWSLLLGAAGGGALTVITLVIRDSFREATGAAKNFSRINGIGSTFIGKSEVSKDGSYVTTEWFTYFFIPVFPVCSYRLIKTRGNLVRQEYQVLNKYPARLKHVIKGYVITLCFALIVLGCFLITNR